MTKAEPNSYSKEAGFTLLEMIAVICLMALAFGLVMPNLGSSRQAMTLRATAIALASDLKIVRSAALASNTEAMLMIDTANRRYSSAVSGKTTKIPRGVDLSYKAKAAEVSRSARAGFRFHPDGTASGGEIRLQSGPASAVISIDWLTGAISLMTR